MTLSQVVNVVLGNMFLCVCVCVCVQGRGGGIPTKTMATKFLVLFSLIYTFIHVCISKIDRPLVLYLALCTVKPLNREGVHIRKAREA